MKPVACINLTAKDYNVYASINDQKEVVGTVAPPRLDFDLVERHRKVVPPIRECQIECGSDTVAYLGGPQERPRPDLYVNDNFWMSCNFACPYCLTDSPEHTRTPNKFFITPPEKLAFLAMLSAYAAEHAQEYQYRIFGGEPTTYPGFLPAVQHLDADPRCIRVVVSTNAHRLEVLRKMMKAVATPQKFEINVSVHPLEKKFNWEGTKLAVRELFQAGFGLYIIGVITTLTKDELPKLSEDLQREMGLGINLFHNLRPDKMR